MLIVLDSKTLCRLLSDAEYWHAISESQHPRFKRKKRAQTPPQQLTAKDKNKIAEDERKVETKLSESDPNYMEEEEEEEDET